MKAKYPDPSIGQVFGLLTCIAVRECKGKNGNWKFRMSCACGNQSLVTKQDLFHSGYVSCGCTRKDAMRGPPGDVSFTGLFDSCKQGAVSRDLLFAITKEQHRAIVIQPCTYCGKQPQPYNFYVKVDGSLRRTTKPARQSSVDLAWIKANGVDRIDSSIGYVISNCAPCCRTCNLAKAEMTAAEYIEHCKTVLAHANKALA